MHTCTPLSPWPSLTSIRIKTLNPTPKSQEASDLASRLQAKRDDLADKVSEDRAREASMARVALKAKEIAKRMGLLARGADQVSHLSSKT